MKILSQITSLSKSKKIILQILFDFLNISLVLIFSKLFLSNFFNIFQIPLIAIIFISIFILLDVYGYIIRFSDSRITIRILISCTLSFFLLLIYSYFFLKFDSNIFLLIFFNSSLIFFNSIIFRKLFKYYFIISNSNNKNISNNLIYIYGAGDAGQKLSRTLQNNKTQQIKGFIDDDISLHNRKINNLNVISFFEFIELYKNIQKNITVIIAIPSLDSQKRINIINQLNQLKIKTKSLPRLEEIILNKNYNEFNDINYLDLLAKDKLYLDQVKIRENILGKSILITGAGGSIGGNLSRYILNYSPKSLIIFDNNEYSLFKIESELEKIKKTKKISCEIIPIIGSITNKHLTKNIFEKFNIDIVYHAAALKHVLLVEKNILESIKINVLGTFNIYNLSKIYGVSKFINISTDKAVNPSNVMGLTKRLSEVILMSQHPNLSISILRFGNVMGSKGSVYEIFEQQISTTKILTLTHLEAKRYFMSINDATQLVIQAGFMNNKRNIYSLKMGDQIKIYDLALKMISMRGLTLKKNEMSDGDVEIKITGLKEGEKLEEELYENQELFDTEHPLIYKFRESQIKNEKEILELLNELDALINENKVGETITLITNFLKLKNFKRSIIDPTI